MQVYGDEFVNGLIEVHKEESKGIIKISAFVSDIGNFRNSKAHQFIFINKRPIKDASLSHSVYSAYEGILPKDKHPIFFSSWSLTHGKLILMSILQREKSDLKTKRLFTGL